MTVPLLPDRKPDKVAGIDALGFILGTALARALGVGLVPIRKGGKLPVETRSEDLVDYSGLSKRLEMRLDAIQPGDRILIVVEWVETGAQISAAIKLIEAGGGRVSGITSTSTSTAEAETDPSSNTSVSFLKPVRYVNHG